MSRRRAREFALQALYGIDQRQQATDAVGVLGGLWKAQLEDGDFDSKPAESKEMDYARILVDGVGAMSSDIDALIESASTNWRIVRMPVVDRNILRMATFELKARLDVPASVVINEAVERHGGS